MKWSRHAAKQAAFGACTGMSCDRSRSLRSSYAAPRTSPPPGGGIGTPSSAYSLSLLRSVRIEMPRMLAAWVRLPRQWSSVSRIRSRSTSATVRPTSDARDLLGGLRGMRRDARAARPDRAGAVGHGDGVGADLVAAGEQHGAMEGVLQFAHVAGPAVDAERALRASAESGRAGRPLALAYFLAKNCASSQRCRRAARAAAGASGSRR